MTEDVANKASYLSNKIIITKYLMTNQSLAIPEDTYLNRIKDLIKEDKNARADFYNIIKALGTKYNKLYKEELRKL